MLILGPFLLWFVFILSVFSTVVATRYQRSTAWLSGFIGACALFTTVMVAAV